MNYPKSFSPSTKHLLSTFHVKVMLCIKNIPNSGALLAIKSGCVCVRTRKPQLSLITTTQTLGQTDVTNTGWHNPRIFCLHFFV